MNVLCPVQLRSSAALMSVHAMPVKLTECYWYQRERSLNWSDIIMGSIPGRHCNATLIGILV